MDWDDRYEGLVLLLAWPWDWLWGWTDGYEDMPRWQQIFWIGPIGFIWDRRS